MRWWLLISFLGTMGAYGDGVLLQKQPDETLVTGQSISLPLNEIDLSLNAKAYILMDAANGKVLKAKNEEVALYPASLTKVLTLYLVAEALKNGQVSLEDRVSISEKAWRTGGSKMFVKVGTEVALKDLIRGVAIVSGNDAAVAIAEYLGGSENNFVQMMNHTAQRLGMQHSHFADSFGFPRPDQYSTVFDLALLTRQWLHDFPEYYFWFQEKWLEYNGIKQSNRNRLLWKYDWVDGVKTGHTEEAGYCLISSGLKDNFRLIAVIIGAPTEQVRNQEMETLLNFGFRNYRRQLILGKNKPIKRVRVYGGKLNYLDIGLSEELWITYPRHIKELKTVFHFKKPLEAPIALGEVCGTVEVQFNNEILGISDLVALEAVPSANFIKRFCDYFRAR